MTNLAPIEIKVKPWPPGRHALEKIRERLVDGRRNRHYFFPL